MSKRMGITLATMAGLVSLSLPTAWAREATDSASLTVLKGQVESRSGAGSWHAGAGSLSDGASVRTGTGAGALMTLPGQVRLRMDQNTQLQFAQIGQNSLQLKLQSGRVFAFMPEKGSPSLVIDGGSGAVQASKGSFVMKTVNHDIKLHVLTGNAQMQGDHVTIEQMPQLQPAPHSWVQVPAGFQAMASVPTQVAQNEDKNEDPDADTKDSNTSENNNAILWGVLGGGALIGIIIGLGGSGGNGANASP